MGAERKVFDRCECGGLLVRTRSGDALVCQREMPGEAALRCEHCFDPLPAWDFAVDAYGDPFCRQCERMLKEANRRRRRG